jgi:hypothetical protein
MAIKSIPVLSKTSQQNITRIKLENKRDYTEGFYCDGHSTLKLIIKKHTEFNIKIHLAFIDHKKHLIEPKEIN